MSDSGESGPVGGVRSRLAGLFGVIGVVALLLAIVVGYTQYVLFDSEQFATRAAATLENEAVRDELSMLITDEVVISAEADLVAFRPLIEGVAGQIVGSSAFRSLFRSSIADVHRAVFSDDERTITLTVINLGIILRGALEKIAPEAAEAIPANLSLLEEDPPEVLVGLAQLAEDTEYLVIILYTIALIALVLGLVLARNRREAIRRGGIGIALGCGLLLVTYWVLHTRLVGMVDEPGLRAALGGVWVEYLQDLRDSLLITAGAAAVVAAAAAALLRPFALERPLTAAWRWIVQRPQSTLLQVLRALALIAIGILIVADTDTALMLVALAVGITLIYLGTQEILRLLVKPVEAASDGAGRRRLVSRNTLVVSSVCAVAIVVAGSIFIASGGVSGADVELPGCNGHVELCDRTLPEVTLPSTHNSFSAADQPDWLFAQHEAGIAAQLAGGVRGFLIDTHWGRKTANGSVITDLSEGNKSRQQYEEEVGEEVVNAALRVRDSISGESPAGEREIYLCHTFCEVGARLLRDELVAMRDFLLANPHQVLVVIVQNEGVGPEEFAEVVEDSGLAPMVYRGSVEEWPTLGEMIRDNERVVFMSEKPPFDVVDWNHEAYAITKETPYSFNHPNQLTNDQKLAASCRPNRGPEDADFFLLNHWIDTSPTPRPSNARIVNAYRPLLRRARECERIRGQRVNLVAVDFWRSGDLFAVVDTLNGVGDEPEAGSNEGED